MVGRGRVLRTGFTIIELLMVMVIFGMIVAFAAPKIDPTRYRVNSSMQVMGTTMLTFWVQGDVGPVAALALLQIAIITVFVLAARHLLGVKFYG